MLERMEIYNWIEKFEVRYSNFKFFVFVEILDRIYYLYKFIFLYKKISIYLIKVVIIL